ncbi:MAG TPA: hypothetical protein DCM08_04770 [Microscillaceae bacterium]|nr:hypothetical protein [Microscillaceae bacterium]
MRNHYALLRQASLAVCWLILGGFILSACGKTSTPTHLIPTQVKWLASFQWQALQTKQPEVWKKGLMKEILLSLGFQLSTPERVFVDKFQEAGISPEWPVFVFSIPGANTTIQVCMFGIDDEAKFVKILEQSIKSTKKTQEAINFMALSDRSLMTWAARVGVWLQTAEPSSAEALLKESIRLRALPEDQSLAKTLPQALPNLSKDNKTDAALWVDVEGLKNIPTSQWLKKYLPFPLTLDWKGSWVNLQCVFEKGEIQMKGKFHWGKPLLAYKAFFKNEVDARLLASLPIKKPIAMAGLGLSRESIFQALEQSGLAGKIDPQVSAATGMTMKELFNIFSGDVVLGVKKIREVETTEGDIDQKTGEQLLEIVVKASYEYVLGVGINNTSSLDKLLAKLIKGDTGLERQGDFYTLKDKENNNFYIVPRGKFLYLTETEEVKNDLLREKAPRIADKYAGLGSESIIVLYSDLQEKVRAKLPSSMFGKKNKEIEQLVKGIQTPFEALSIRLKPVADDNTSELLLAWEMKDKDLHALQSLLDHIVVENSFTQILRQPTAEAAQ